MNGSPVDGYKVGGCAPLVWIVLATLLVAGLVWATKSLWPGIFAGLILGSVVVN